MNIETHSLERSVLGFVMLFPKSVNRCIEEIVTIDWFAETEARAVWRAIMEIHAGGHEPDLVAVAEKIRADKLTDVVKLPDLAAMLDCASATGLSFADDIELLREAFNARNRASLWIEGGDAASAGRSETEEETAQRISGTFASHVRKQTLQGAAAELAAELEGGALADYGLHTGLIDLDRGLGTLQPGELVIVAARPGVGKSSLTRQIGVKVALDGRGTVLVSTEMGAKEIALAAAKQQTGIAWQRDGRNGCEEQAKFAEMIRRLSVLSTFKLVEIRSLAAMIGRFEILMADEYPPALFVIDYVQQIDAAQQKGETLSSAIGRVSSALKSFALKHKVSVVAAAQLNRESVKDGEPQLIHLRDSGSLEQDADRVLMLKLADEEHTDLRHAVVQVFQKKNRNGAQGKIDLVFDRWTTQFANHTP